MVEEARAAAKVEIESARTATRRIEEGLEEQERLFGGISQQELDDMRRELQDARRIKMLHESSKRFLERRKTCKFCRRSYGYSSQIMHCMRLAFQEIPCL
ncbi:hypothetical protein KP509_17G010000 [Ceratopteris richardii]|uniref:Stomatal closure-related actin-binding protein coiled-coil domain-containing protein n=1 Tax=Ceratopteris richardii TaxID=49495 RepID=A0A8T2SSR5_CERRI|nr:hypothetical protein KP509_17G010000 [Ceratopteris richardii]